MYSTESTVLYHCNTPPLIDVAVPPKDITDVNIDDSNQSTHSGSQSRALRPRLVHHQASAALPHVFGSSSTKRPPTLGASVDDVRDLPRRSFHLATKHHHRYPNFVLLFLLLHREEDRGYGRECRPASSSSSSAAERQTRDRSVEPEAEAGKTGEEKSKKELKAEMKRVVPEQPYERIEARLPPKPVIPSADMVRSS